MIVKYRPQKIVLFFLLHVLLIITVSCNLRVAQQITPPQENNPSEPADQNDTSISTDDSETNDDTETDNNDYYINSVTNVTTNTTTTSTSNLPANDYVIPTPPAPVYEGDLSNVTIPPWLSGNDTELVFYLTDKYNYFVTNDGNKAWAGALNLCWNQFKRTLLKGQNATFQQFYDPIQQRLVDNLNSDQFTINDLSEDSYYVAAGLGQSTVQKINRQVRQKFPQKTFEDLALTLQDTDFISYAYIFKQLHYPVPFEDDYNFYFKDQNVKAFQALNSKQRKQLYYKYHNNDDDFLMGIQAKDPNEQILLLKSPYTGMNQLRFEKIIKIIDFFETLPNHKLAKIDKFSMPELDFDFSRKINELSTLTLSNPDIDCRSITAIIQNLKVKMNKEGVIMQNEAYMIVGMGWGGPVPKYFYLDNDFWLILKQKGKVPYLIMLVKSVKQKWSI